MFTNTYLMTMLSQIDVTYFMFNYYFKEFEPGWSMRKPHSHDAIEIICCLKGSGQLNLYNNHMVHTEKLCKNDMLIVKQGVLHKLFVNNAQNKFVNIQLRMDFLEENNQKFSFIDNAFYNMGCIKIIDDHIVSEAMKRLAIEMNNKEEGYDLLAKAEIINVLIRINRILCNNTTNYDSKYNYIRQALSFINSSLQYKIDPQTVADNIHISSGYLMHLFNEYLGKTVMKYITEERLNQGKRLLANTNQPISEIAIDIGYSNIQHFSSDFKKYNGITPSEFRKTSQSINLLNVT